MFNLQILVKREPTSGLEPLTCSLRVIGQALQGCAGVCKSPVSRRLSLLRIAASCTVLRSRWYQSGINITFLASCREGRYGFDLADEEPAWSISWQPIILNP